MDISGATAGIYSVPIFNVPQPAGMQTAQLTAPNPNATSPRPSILRKRTSEGYGEIYFFTTEPSVVSTAQLEREGRGSVSRRSVGSFFELAGN